MWWLYLPEGRSLDATVRCAELALALDRVGPCQVLFERAAAPWRRLLSVEQQARLASLRAQPATAVAAAEALLQRMASLLRDEAGMVPPLSGGEHSVSLWCRPSQAVAPCTQPRMWLVQLDNEAPVDPKILATYERSFAFAPFSRSVPPGLTCLPVAVDRQLFQPGAATPDADRVLVIGNGNSTVTQRAAQRLQQEGVAHITLFDPYHRDVADMPTGTHHVGLCGPAERAAAFGECACVVVADLAVHCDNHFFWEAVALGATPLAAWAGGAATWTGPLVRACVAAWRDGAAPVWEVPVASWGEVVRFLTPRAPPAIPPPKPRAALPQVVMLRGSGRVDAATARSLGIWIATHDIASGLEKTAPGRFDLLWLDQHSAESERGRIYLYPNGEVGGRGPREVDYPALPRLLAAGQVDALCSVDPFLNDAIGARELWAKKAVPAVGMMHSIHGADFVTHMILQLLEGASYPFDAMVSPSRCGAAAYRELMSSLVSWTNRGRAQPVAFRGRVEVIPYGIDLDMYRGLSRPACRHTLGLAQDTVLILSVGRLRRREKADLLPLLVAIKSLRQRGHPVSLVMAGGSNGPEYPAALRSAIAALGLSQDVFVSENVSLADKLLLYGAADVFVSVSDNLQETHGLAVLEAMAARLPVVASEWDGAREIVCHGDTGFLVPTTWQLPSTEREYLMRLAAGPGGYGHRDLHESVVVDIDALVAALEALVSNSELRASMGERGRAVCAQEFHVSTQAVRLGDLFLQLIAEAQATPWSPDPLLQPFHDSASRRFYAYPTGAVRGSHGVQATPLSADRALSDTLLAAVLHPGSPAEMQMAHRIIDAARAAPGTTIDSLANALSDASWSPEDVALRVVRCAKYGLLRLLL